MARIWRLWRRRRIENSCIFSKAFVSKVIKIDMKNKINNQNKKKKSKIKALFKTFLIFIIIFIIFLIFMVIFQWKPIRFTQEQEKYIWNWQWDWISLIINKNSYVIYNKQKDNVTTATNWPMVEIDDDNFKVWVWFIKVNFDINKEPFLDWDQRKMIVDWNELVKVLWESDLKVPEVSELNKLTNDFFTLFNDTVYKDDYESFYNWISKFWQSQISPEELESWLSTTYVVKDKVNFPEIIRNEIIYTIPPFIDENNLLTLEWSYTWDTIIKFQLKFIYEHPEWKIVIFNIGTPKN